MIPVRIIAVALVFILVLVPVSTCFSKTPEKTPEPVSFVSQGTFQELDTLINELARYSQDVTNMITTTTIAGGAADQRTMILKDIYNGLSIMICNLIALRMALRIEKLHWNFKQTCFEATSEVKGYASYIDMHQNIQLGYCNKLLPTTQDPLVTNQLNAYIGYLQRAKNIIESVKKELPV